MKQGSLFGAALAAVFALAIAGPVSAKELDKSSPQLMQAPASSSSSSSSACVDASGKPVTDTSMCSSGGCVDASGRAVTDVSVCDVKSPRDSASGMATGKRQHKPMQ